MLLPSTSTSTRVSRAPQATWGAGSGAELPAGLPEPLPPALRPQEPAAGLPGLFSRSWDWLSGLVKGDGAVRSRIVHLFSGPQYYPADPIGGGGGSYTVRSGDSLSLIAKRELGDVNRWREIFDANRDQLSNPNLIYPGQALKLPGGSSSSPAPKPASGGSYTVRSGDTLGAIAQATLGDANRWRELFDANRDQISNPNVIFPGQVLQLPGGAKAPVSSPVSAPAPSSWGGKVVAAGRNLKASGYRYPPDLSANYYHKRFQVGCCADFAVDTWTKAGVDIYREMVNGGYNPHYCPSQVKFFLDSPTHTLLNANQRAQVGDFVFFRWPGDDATASHVAIVTAVDGNGKPTRIIESYDFNQPVREREVGNSVNSIVYYGRL